MSDLYNEVMEHIQVTDDMRIRIMNHVDHAPVSGKLKKKRTVIRPIWIKALAGAACLALIAGTVWLMAPGSNPGTAPGTVVDAQPTPTDDMEETLGIWNVTECKSADELSKAAGFTMDEISEIPFKVTETGYLFYENDGIAEISYNGKNNCAILRKAKGKDDISGSYYEYKTKQTKTIGPWKDVILQGSKKKVALLTWQDEEFSYSLSFTTGITETQAEKILKNMK